MPQMRLEQYCAQAARLSRAQAKQAVQKGRVRVNGKPGKAGQKIDPQEAAVTLDGAPLFWKKHLYLMLNKPLGVVSASRDGKDVTVLDLVPQELRRPGLFPAGRLDKETTGFVLITDDGDFAHRMLAPKSHVPKTYLALLAGRLDENARRTFREGCVLRDGTRCLPAELEILEEGENTLARIVLREGKYHQIRRMAAACGSRVLELRRIALGGLPLDENLAPGACREILHKELEKIWAIFRTDETRPEI